MKGGLAIVVYDIDVNVLLDELLDSPLDRKLCSSNQRSMTRLVLLVEVYSQVRVLDEYIEDAL